MTNSPSFGQDEKQHLDIVPSKESQKSESTPAELYDLPTAGQLMRSVSQAVERVYREQLDHHPASVKCNLIDEKVVIWVEESMTPLEKLLYAEDVEKSKLLRITIDKLMNSFFADAIAKELGIEVLTLILETSYTSDCTGMIAQLSQSPAVRLPARKAAAKGSNRSRQAG